MSGFEVAGLILGIFPLCITLLEKYERGTAIILDMRDYHSLLREFLRELEMEQCKFENTLYGILDDTVMNPQECQEIFQNPTIAHQDEWYKARFSGPKVVKVFVEAAQEIRKELMELQQRLESLDVSPRSTGSAGDAQAANMNVDDAKYSRRLGRKLLNRYKLSRFKSEYSCRIKKIRCLNYDISVLVSNGARERAEKYRLSKAQGLAIEKYYKQVRSNAHSICNALTQRMQTQHGCGSNSTHAISLCLETRNASEVLSNMRTSTSTAENPSGLSFKILLSLFETNPSGGVVPTSTTYSYRWRELEVEAIEDASTVQEEVQEEVHDSRYNSQASNTLTLSTTHTQHSSSDLKRTGLAIGTPSIHSTANRTGRKDEGPGDTRTPSEDIGSGASTLITAGHRGLRKMLKWADSQEDPSQGSSQLNRNQKQLNLKPGGAADASGPTRTQLPTSQPERGGTSFANDVRQINSGYKDSMLAVDAGYSLIHDICQTIKTAPPSKRRCLGLLDCAIGDPTHKYRVWSIPVGGCFGLTDTLDSSTPTWLSNHVSLQELLETASSPGCFRKPPPNNRLSIAIKLASAAIQLHRTRWLQRSWGKQDIIFFADPWSNAPLTEKPVILHNLNSSPHQTSPSQQVFNKPLFPLGIVLLELWLWKRLEDFNMDANGKAQTFDAGDEATVDASVGKAFKKLSLKAPKTYEDAVHACLYNTIPTDSPDFIPTVWKNVLCPLQENLNFWGGTFQSNR